MLGAIGHTDIKPGILEKEILPENEVWFRQYINLRPIKLYPNVPTPLKILTLEILTMLLSENTGGLYTGKVV